MLFCLLPLCGMSLLRYGKGKHLLEKITEEALKKGEEIQC